MISATDVAKQIRRSLLILFLVYVAMSALLATVAAYNTEYGTFLTNFFTVFVLAVCFAVVVVYPGKYVPITSKHESLLNRYGSIYLAEAERAMSKNGMNRMLSTCWFEIYADDFCERQSTTVDAE